MKLENFRHIIRKFLQGNTSAAEEQTLKTFENKLLAQNAAEVFAHTPAEKVHHQLSKRIANAITPQRFRYSWAAAAAIAVLIMGAVSWWWFSPASTTAGVATQELQWLTKATAKGETLTLTLPDGSAVTLNSESTLRYPTAFEGTLREVQLEGEAFFEVTKDPKKPFIVTADALSTEVLGTSFNVEAYPAQQEVKVTLATGKVRVIAGNEQCELAPDQQAIFQKVDQHIAVQTVAVDNFTDWKDGLLRFSESTLPAVAQKLEKRYGVQIHLKVKNANHCYVSGTFMNEDLSVVLKQLTFVHQGLQYEYIDSQHVVLKGECE